MVSGADNLLILRWPGACVSLRYSGFGDRILLKDGYAANQNERRFVNVVVSMQL